mgnify:FL=1
MGLKRGLIIFICIGLIIYTNLVSAALGDNLVVNGDFSTGDTSSWSFSNAKNASIDYFVDTRFSDKSLVINGKGNIFAYQSINLESGKSYNLSFIALRQGQPASTFAIQGPGESWQTIDKIDVLDSSGNFVLFSKIITITTTGSYKFVLTNGNTPTTSTNSYFDNIKLVEMGPITTPSTPTPTPTSTTPLISNGDFSTGDTSSWSFNQSKDATWDYYIDTKYSDKSLVLGGRRGFAIQEIQLAAGTYNLSFDALKQGDSISSIAIQGPDVSWQLVDKLDVPKTLEFKSFSKSITIHPKGLYKIILIHGGYDWTSYTYFDNIRLVQTRQFCTDCIDNDIDSSHPNGKNYEVKGTCTSGAGQELYHTDICDADAVSGGGQKSWLWEQFVNPDGNCDYELYFCEDDGKTCLDGRCVDIAEDQVFDTDSDADHPNGKSYEVYGICLEKKNEQIIKHDDVCDENQKSWLWEQFVNSSGNCDYELHYCENEGKSCNKGECVLAGEKSECASKSNANKKVPVRTREKVGDKIWYCDTTTLEYIQAKSLGADCVADYECQSNVCIDSKCTSIRQELEVQGKLIKEIWCWIQGVVPGGDNQEECRSKLGLTP